MGIYIIEEDINIRELFDSVIEIRSSKINIRYKGIFRDKLCDLRYYLLVTKSDDIYLLVDSKISFDLFLYFKKEMEEILSKHNLSERNLNIISFRNGCMDMLTSSNFILNIIELKKINSEREEVRKSNSKLRAEIVNELGCELKCKNCSTINCNIRSTFYRFINMQIEQVTHLEQTLCLILSIKNKGLSNRELSLISDFIRKIVTDITLANHKR